MNGIPFVEIATKWLRYVFIMSFEIFQYCLQDETEALQSEMNQDERLFAQPTKPWSFLYRGENEKPGMHSVKVDRDRPKWWPAELLEKRNK